MMTNTVQSPEKERNSNRFLIGSLITLAVLGFSALFYVAYQHGDGSIYATGYEMGRMIGSFIEARSFKNGIRLGSIIAVLTSWERNKSILWAILHALFGWAYVIYFALTRKSNQV